MPVRAWLKEYGPRIAKRVDEAFPQLQIVWKRLVDGAQLARELQSSVLPEALGFSLLPAFSTQSRHAVSARTHVLSSYSCRSTWEISTLKACES